MRKLLVVLAISLVLGAVIGLQAGRGSFEERVLAAEAETALSLPPETIRQTQPAVLATLLAYTDDETLLFNARAALSRYPAKTRRVLALYGMETKFQAILRDYGAGIIPPIHYYLENDSYALHVMRYTGEQMERANELAERLWHEDGRQREDAVVETGNADSDKLTPTMRGWYAVNFIHEEGHDFLGQFVVDDSGEVQRVQFERVIEGTTGFFTSGMRTLERKYLDDQTITGSDYVWAGVDMAVMAGAVKILRAGRAATNTAQAGSTAARTGMAARALTRTGRIGLGVAKYGAVPAAVVLAITHPSAISGLLYDIATASGISPTATLIGGWALLLLPLVFIGLTLFKWLLRPLIGLLRGVSIFLRWLERRSTGQRPLFSGS